MRGNRLLAHVACGMSAALLAPSVLAVGPTVVRATVILREGDNPPGVGADTVATLNAPFTDGNGQVGFVAAMTSGDRIVWQGTGVSFVSSSIVSPVLTGGEGTMGHGSNGEFIYSPSADGQDAVFSQNGLILADGDAAPGFAVGTVNTFNSRPTMLPGGTAYWIAGYNESGGTSTQGRVVYKSSDATNGNTVVVLRTGDIVNGLPLTSAGVDFDYNASDDDSHYIQVIGLDTGSTTDDNFVYVDGATVARETDPTGDGDNWDNFDIVAINNAGDYLFTGDTDGDTASDEFIAYNGTIVIREGDIVGGVTLTSSAFLRAVSLNNNGQAVHAWGISGGDEILFYASDASNLAGTSVALLSTNDMLDFDGDGLGDATLTDFNASGTLGPGLNLAENGLIYLEVDIDEGGGDIEAIIVLSTDAGEGASFCDASDGALATCACAAGDPDTGCDAPIPVMQGGGTTGGVRLDLVAQSFSPQNRMTASGTGYPAGSAPTAIVIRDPSLESAGPIVFGDGLRCVGTSSLTRLGATVAAAGVSNHTFGHGTMAGAGTFYYQLWFRSTPISFCDPAAAFNLSNGRSIVW